MGGDSAVTLIPGEAVVGYNSVRSIRSLKSMLLVAVEVIVVDGRMRLCSDSHSICRIVVDGVLGEEWRRLFALNNHSILFRVADHIPCERPKATFADTKISIVVVELILRDTGLGTCELHKAIVLETMDVILQNGSIGLAIYLNACHGPTSELVVKDCRR